MSKAKTFVEQIQENRLQYSAPQLARIKQAADKQKPKAPQKKQTK